MRDKEISFGFELETQSSGGFNKLSHRKNHEKAALLKKWKLDSFPILLTHDHSVDGFEFQTVGPLNEKIMLKILKCLFTVQHEIDVNCSMHYHFGLMDQSPIHDAKTHFRVQSSMLENLQKHIKKDLLPDYLEERLKSGPIRFFQIQTSPYEPVARPTFRRAFHAHSLGTWEMRWPGNVACFDDAAETFEICKKMFMEAPHPVFHNRRKERT